MRIVLLLLVGIYWESLGEAQFGGATDRERYRRLEIVNLRRYRLHLLRCQGLSDLFSNPLVLALPQPILVVLIVHHVLICSMIALLHQITSTEYIPCAISDSHMPPT